MGPKMIELIILFAIAAFVLFRLKSVIGTRSGYEAPPDYLKRDPAAQAVRPDPAEEDEVWPNTEFELVRSPDEGVEVGVFGLGRKLEPVRVIQPEEVTRPLDSDGNEQLVPGDLLEFAESMTSAPNGPQP